MAKLARARVPKSWRNSVALTELLLFLGLVVAPEEDNLPQKVRLLRELTTITRTDCAEHDELVEHYEAAVAEAHDGSAAVVFELRLGLVGALLLRREQAGHTRADSTIAQMLDDLAAEPEARAHEKTLDELRASLATIPKEPCVEPESSTLPTEPSGVAPPGSGAVEEEPLVPEPRPASPDPASMPERSVRPPRWTRGERWSVASGTVAGGAGLFLLGWGIAGPYLARARIDGTPDSRQQEFLDVQVARRGAGLTGIGGTLTALGTGLAVYGLTRRYCRRWGCG